MPLIASNQAETPDLILRNHSSVRISHWSLKLTILQIFFMLVKSLKQWAHWVKSNICGLLRRGRRVNIIVRLLHTRVVSEVCLSRASSRGQNLKTIEDGSVQATACFSFLWFVSLLFARNKKKRNEHYWIFLIKIKLLSFLFVGILRLNIYP